MIALVAENAHRAGLLDQRREFVEFLARLRRLQVSGVDIVQRVELAATRRLAYRERKSPKSWAFPITAKSVRPMSNGRI